MRSETFRCDDEVAVAQLRRTLDPEVLLMIPCCRSSNRV